MIKKSRVLPCIVVVCANTAAPFEALGLASLEAVEGGHTGAAQ